MPYNAHDSWIQSGLLPQISRTTGAFYINFYILLVLQGQIVNLHTIQTILKGVLIKHITREIKPSYRIIDLYVILLIIIAQPLKPLQLNNKYLRELINLHLFFGLHMCFAPGAVPLVALIQNVLLRKQIHTVV